MTLNEAAKQFLLAYFEDGKIRQPEHGPEVEIIQEEIKLFAGAAVLKVEKSKYSGWDVQIMVESATHLWLLGKYVGIRVKTLHNKDY
jgi:hypothetical protein